MGNEKTAAGAASDSSEKLITRLRRKYPWLDHMLRANDAFNERYGNHYAAAITYFSVLSVIPI
ncbi:MAG: inner membrane protein YhjD, partial [Haloechinothrix sp.]